MSLEYKTIPFLELKSEGDGASFSGYCAAFHNVDATGDVILPGAFKDTLPDFLKRGKVCYDHGPVIGKPLEAHEDPKGLYIKGVISDTAAGRDCKTLLKDDVLREMSIGYESRGRRPATPDDVKAHWQSAGYTPSPEDLSNMERHAQNNSLSFLTAIKLHEASPVGFAANPLATIEHVGKGGLRLSEIKSEVQQLRGELKSGRTLSAATCDRLKGIHDHLDPALSDLKCLLKEADDAATLAAAAAADQKAPTPKGPAGPHADGKSAAVLEHARNTLALLACDPCLS